MVLIGHGSGTAPPGLLPWPLVSVFGNGGLGVLVFFCISGFLITKLLMNEEAKHGRISLKNFYIRRSFRILPAFLVFMLFIVALKAMGIIHVTTANIVSALLFVTNYSPYSESWILGHTWTLSVEEQFYLFWPFLLVALGQKRSMKVGIALIFALPFVRVATYFLMPTWREHITVMAHTRIDAMMFGCVAALAAGHDWFENLYNRLCRWKLHLVLPLLSLLVYPFLAKWLAGKFMLPVGLTLNALAATLGMLWLIRNADTPVGRFFNGKVISWIGVLSYSLYLWQQPFFSSEPLGWTTTFGINIVVIFAIAIASYYLIEQPFLRLRAKWF